MKKIVLSLAGVLAATAFAPEASAIPAFARQTGMACTACHAQHFPVLNGFGRAFKAAGYTMVGAQGKVEGEHLSIPDTLNAAILLKYRYQQNGRAANVGAGVTAGTGAGAAAPFAATTHGMWQVGDEFSLFFGGRVADNIGFLMENNVANAGGTLVAGLRLPITFDMGGATLSVVPLTTDALGVAYGYELSSGGVMRANRWAEHRREISAIQYNADRGADGGAATGFAFVAQNDMGFINVTRWSPSFAPGANGGNVQSTDYRNNYVRIAATPTVGDWAMVVGAGHMSGSSYSVQGAAQLESRQTFFDAQAHGEVGGKELGIYAQHASAPATVIGNVYNTGTLTRKAWTLGADYSVIPHVLSLGLAYRNADTGVAVAGVNSTEDAWTVTAVYDLYQNVAVHLNYSDYSGTGTAATRDKNLTTLMLEASW